MTRNERVAAYIDAKAATAARYARRNPNSAPVHENTARVLGALADDIRKGLHEGDDA